MSELSRAQVDRLGERLRAGDSISSEDRVLLDEYRRSLASYSHTVTQRLQHLLDLPITERPGKTTPSIIAKLKRQPTALSRMQDMAGGRVVVGDLRSQDSAISEVRENFQKARFVDRRESPMVGYHAAHFVIREDAQSYELQIRTEAQQRWAQLSEKLADLVGFGIKYGDGPEELEAHLISSGRIIYLIEKIKQGYEEMLELDHDALLESELDRNEMLAEIAEADEELEFQFTELERIIAHLERQ
jgi:GTP pyrophosphokinase